MNKKTLALILSAFLFSFSACKSKNQNQNTIKVKTETPAPPSISSEATPPSIAIPNTPVEWPQKIEGAPGYNQPNQYITVQTTSLADNMEPVIPHPTQEAEARQKLANLESRFKKKPNVIIFLMDDVGWMDPGFNGGGVAVGNPTPHMDQAASQGLILTSTYSQPSCSPTRATIMTGQLPIHRGILIPPMYGQPGGLAGITTLAKLMSDLGYITQAIGKWHMGENEGSQPQNVGFDDFRGFLSVSDMYTEWRDPHYNPEVALSPQRTQFMQRLPFDKDDVHAVKGGTIEKVQEINLETIKNLDREWAKYGENFLRKMAKSDKPFFLYYNTRGCHFDNYPNEYYAGRSPSRTTYGDCMIEMDDIFGKLVNALKETGQLENTLIVLSSDNGPEQEVAPYGHTPFRGGKGSTWEGGVRVPTFVYWPGMIQPRKSDGLFDLADLFNTFISLAGKPGAELGKLLPPDRYTDGIDQVSFLLGNQGESNRRSVIHYWNTQLSAIRMDEFKALRLAQLPNSLTQRGEMGGFTGTVAPTAGAVIFNLYTNPQEDESVGIRHIPMALPFDAEIQRYLEVMKKYPSKVQISF